MDGKGGSSETILRPYWRKGVGGGLCWDEDGGR